MSWISLLFGVNGWGHLLLTGTMITVLLSATTVPFGFGFGRGLLLAVLKLSRNRRKGARIVAGPGQGGTVVEVAIRTVVVTAGRCVAGEHDPRATRIAGDVWQGST